MLPRARLSVSQSLSRRWHRVFGLSMGGVLIGHANSRESSVGRRSFCLPPSPPVLRLMFQKLDTPGGSTGFDASIFGSSLSPLQQIERSCRGRTKASCERR